MKLNILHVTKYDRWYDIVELSLKSSVALWIEVFKQGKKNTDLMQIYWFEIRSVTEI